MTRVAMTFADLDAWAKGVIDDSEETAMIPGRFVPTLISRTFPPCPGCGGAVGPYEGAAVTIDVKVKAATFQPCGCVLVVPDMPCEPVEEP